MKYKELQSKPEAEVKKLLEELENQAKDLAMKIRLNQVKNNHQARAIRKDIARVRTYLRTVINK